MCLFSTKVLMSWRNPFFFCYDYLEASKNNCMSTLLSILYTHPLEVFVSNFLFRGGMMPLFSNYIFFELVPAFLGLFAYSHLRPAKLTKSWISFKKFYLSGDILHDKACLKQTKNYMMTPLHSMTRIVNSGFSNDYLSFDNFDIFPSKLKKTAGFKADSASHVVLRCETDW